MQPGLRAALGVFAGLLLAAPLVAVRELGWYAAGGRMLAAPTAVARVGVVALDALTDAPLQGVRAWCDTAGSSTRTDASGRAELEFEAGTTWIVSGGRGRALAGLRVELPEGESEQVLRLLPAEKLAGRVLLPDGGAAAGAHVEATPLEWPAVPVETPNADEDGRFLVPRPGPGTYRVEAALEGEGRAVALVRTPDEAVHLQLSPAPLPELPGAGELPDNALPARGGGRMLEVRGPDGGSVPGAFVLGVVGVDVDGGSPGAARRAGRLPLLCTTDLSGRCRVPGDTPCLMASAPPHADSEVACGPSALVLLEGHALSGRAEVPGAAGGWVAAEAGPLSAVGRDGRFVLAPLPAGRQTLRLYAASGAQLGGAHVEVPARGEWSWPTQGDDAVP